MQIYSWKIVTICIINGIYGLKFDDNMRVQQLNENHSVVKRSAGYRYDKVRQGHRINLQLSGDMRESSSGRGRKK